MLSLKHKAELRAALAWALAEQPDTALLCWQQGQQVDNLSTAFFVGYQAAMRCLDPVLPAFHWAALAISEKGIKSPFQCLTSFDAQSGALVGAKSHIMLADDGLDSLYVLAHLAQIEPVQLVLVQLPASAVQIEHRPAQPFLLDVPHYAVSFNALVQPEALYCVDAHQRANKPFRYWEDVHVVLAMAGWLQSQLFTVNHELTEQAQRLIAAFREEPRHYHLAALDEFENMLALLARLVSQLSDEQQQQWQQDTLLLKMTAPLRQQIRAKLLS